MVRQCLATLCALLALAAPRCIAQTWGGNPALNQLEQHYVKSLNEFMHRFNGDEVPQWLQADTGTDQRKRCILALCDLYPAPDLGSPKAMRTMEFIDTVCQHGTTLHLADSGLYAVAVCQFSYRKKTVELRLTMVHQHLHDGLYRWAIAGVYPAGLREAGLLENSRQGYINPVNHELHFSELSRAFPSMEGFLADGHALDALSFMAGLAESGVLKFEGCTEVEYWFMQVPHWVFCVTLHPRNHANSGWLIRDIVPLGDQKQQFVKTYLGIP